MNGPNGARLPTLAELKQYAVNRDNEFEITKQTLYDTLTYAAAGQSQLTFFQEPIGQNGKTKADTNIESAGQLPAPKYFLIESIEIRFFPDNLPANTGATYDPTTSIANDVYTLQKSGYLELFIGSKAYLTEAPLGKFPPKTCLETEFAYATTAAGEEIGGDYAVFSGRPYYIDPHITLIPTQNFNVNLNWPTLVPLPSAKDARIQVSFDGLLYRLSQ